MPVISIESHNQLVHTAYRSRGYTEIEAADAVKLCASAARHGIKTHNAIKALHLDDHFGSKAGGCTPGAKIEVLPTRFKATQIWNANRKLGQSVAYAAMETCMKLADEYGTGTVAVDNAFHYLWGGGYVIDAAQRGYIAYTNCTSAMAEVVPLGGKFPTLGTNPHSWGLPTTHAVGFPICLDWATSTVAMGRVQQLLREGKDLPPNAAVDSDGQPTNDPAKAKWLLPFGAHKGYGLALLNELYGAYIGGSLPTLRGRPDLAPVGEKTSAAFFFHVIHPEAIDGADHALGRNQASNVDAVLKDILSHGNEGCMLPGQPEANAAKASDEAGGLIFTDAEVKEFDALAESLGLANWR